MKFLVLFIILSISTLFSQVPSNAHSLLKAGKTTQVISICNQALKKNPNDLQALELLGDAFAAQADWAQALEQFTRLKTLKPTVANYEYKYGGSLGMIAKESSTFKAMQLISDIRQSFENAIKLEPNHIDARWALIEFNLQLPAIAGGSQTKARKYATELLKISPVDGYLAEGHIDEYLKKYTAAEKNYKAAITSGQSKIAYQKLADLYKNKMQQPQKAVAIMSEFHRIQ